MLTCHQSGMSYLLCIIYMRPKVLVKTLIIYNSFRHIYSASYIQVYRRKAPLTDAWLVLIRTGYDNNYVNVVTV